MFTDLANNPLRKLFKLIVAILEKSENNRELIVIGKSSYSGSGEHWVLKCNFCSWVEKKIQAINTEKYFKDNGIYAESNMVL